MVLAMSISLKAYAAAKGVGQRYFVQMTKAIWNGTAGRVALSVAVHSELILKSPVPVNAWH